MALRAILVTSACLMFFLGSFVRPAAASELIFSDPLPDAMLELPLETVTLQFAEPVAIGRDDIAISADGVPVELSNVEPFEGGETYVVTVTAPVTNANVMVAWTATNALQEPVAGTLAFAVGDASPPVAFPDLGGAEASQPPAVDDGADVADASNDEPVEPIESVDQAVQAEPVGQPAVVAQEDPRIVELVPEPPTSRSRLTTMLATLSRSLATTAAMIVIGGFIFLSLLHRGTTRERHLLVRVYQVAASALFFGTLVAFFARSGELAGSVTSMIDPRSLWAVAETRFGAGTFLRLVGAAALVAGSKRWLVGLAMFERERSTPVPQSVGAAANPDTGAAEYAVQTMVLVAFGAMITLLSFPFFSVAGAAAPALIIEIIHVGAAAILAGGTASLVAVIELRRRRGESLRVMTMAGRFLNVAFASLIVAFLTGFMLSLVELDGISSYIERGYGAASLLKIALTAILALALLRGRKDFTPGISDDAAAEFVGWLDNALRIGAAIGLAILVLSSWLTVAL